MKKTMSNQTVRLSLGVVAVGAAALLVPGARGQNAYNNTTTYNGNFNYVTSSTSATAGNEVILTGGLSSYNITSFSFQYDFSGSDVPSTATADLIFYQNNGTQVSGYSGPGTVLFNSGPFSLGTGSSAYTTGATATFNTAALGGGVTVPQIFTWAVTFSGLTSSESAGLGLFGTIPSVGQNYGDAWYNPNGTSGTWALDVASSGNPALTFGAQIGAAVVPEPSSIALFAMGATGLVASGWRKLRR